MLNTKRYRLRDSKEDWPVIEIYKDAGVSAKNTNRPEFNRMTDDIEQGKIDVTQYPFSLNFPFSISKLFPRHPL
ncbi:MAG TPA: hypothetical protein DEA99_00255 [Candidatus Omnitrophica bacterium]|nr:hypothetical protein [Candidatus Omnitrophota bacterium]